jgi:hypothetical protein
MQTSLLFVLLFVADALKNYIGFVGFRDSHHLYVFVIELYNLGEGTFTYFTLEFSKIIALGDSFDLFFNFTVDPGFKAPNMN